MKTLATIAIPISALTCVGSVGVMGWACGTLVALPNGIPLCLLAVIVIGCAAAWLATKTHDLWDYVHSDEDDRPRRNTRRR